MKRFLLFLALIFAPAVAQAQFCTGPGCNVSSGGTVTSVGLSAPAIFTVGGTPVTTSGTLALTYSGTALPVANGGTAATSAGITAVNNISGRSYGGFTGTGNLVGSASPTFSGTVAGANTIPLTILQQAAANTMVGNWTSGTGNEVANALTSCPDTGGNHLNYVSGTGITCGTSVGGATVLSPQGRLTLQSGSPVQTSDVGVGSTIYYDAYIGTTVPIYNGSSFTNLSFPTEISVGLSSSYSSLNMFDVFAYSNAGSLTLGIGPAWSSLSARGTGAGTTEINQTSGLWTNKNSITLQTTGPSTTVVAANQATYLGSFKPSGTGFTAMTLVPSGSGGQALLWNAYNRVLTTISTTQGGASSWTYASTAWQRPNNSGSGAYFVSYVDGLAQSFVRMTYTISVQSSLITVFCSVGVGVNPGSVVAAGITPNYATTSEDPVSATGYSSMTATGTSYPVLGSNVAQAVESASGATCTFQNPSVGGATANSYGFTLSLEM